MLHAVTPKLFLSSPLTRPEQFPELVDAKIRYVVNAASIPNREMLENHGFRVCMPFFMDLGKRPPIRVWEVLMPFMEEALASQFNLAAHCIGGPRRSIACLYFALRLQGISAEGATKFLTVAAPNQSLIYCSFADEYLESLLSGAPIIAATS